MIDLRGESAAAPVYSKSSPSSLNSILESTSDLVIAVSSQWVVSYANGAALRSFPALKVGQQYWRCFPLLQGTAAEKYQREAMEGQFDVHYEALYAPCNKWYKVDVYPIEAGVSVFLRDVSDEKAVEDKFSFEQLLREKRIEALSHMAGGLAHEISNPLAIIHGWAQDLKEMTLRQDFLAPREVSVLCDKILKTTDRASNILRGLKAFGRDGAHDPLEPTSIYTILDQVFELQESRFARNTIEIRTDLQPDIPLLQCREVQIWQILTNLLNNAFDAIVQSESPERWVSVKAVLSQANVCIDVSDSGPGVSELQKKHLMKPFFSTKELGFGMGIGLSLSRAIAQSHGGTLTLMRASEPTCFRLCLPTTASIGPEYPLHFGEATNELEQG